MQDFIDQAQKNGVILSNTGNCQFCGANFLGGIFECMNKNNHAQELLDFTQKEYHLSRFLSVDAHALQHPEIHGRWSNHFHLTRLNLILVKNQAWDYQKSPLLSTYLNEYKLQFPDEFLNPPKVLERGKITVFDLSKTDSTEACVEWIGKWAVDVYQAWHAHHEHISGLAEGFLNKYNHRKTTNNTT